MVLRFFKLLMMCNLIKYKFFVGELSGISDTKLWNTFRFNSDMLDDYSYITILKKGAGMKLPL